MYPGILICILVLFSSCNLNKNNELVFPQGAKLVYKYSFDINDCNKFGFKKYETGEVLSVNCMLVNGDLVYLSDPVQRNIKKIDINTGKILKCSDVKDNFITSLCYFNDSIYALTYGNCVIVFDQNLEVSRQIDFHDYIGDKYIFSRTEDTLIIYRAPTDVIQDINHSVFVKRKIITKQGELKIDTILIGKGYDKFKEFKERNINGKNVDMRQADGDSLVVRYKNNVFTIGEQIPKIKQYDCQNADFTNDHFVYFDISTAELILTIWNHL